MMMERISSLVPSETEEDRFFIFLVVMMSFVIIFPVVLWAIDLLTVRTYFIACFIWLLILIEVLGPIRPARNWWYLLQWIKFVGWIILIYILFERVIAVLQPG
jgi:hypothetical protein